MLTRKKGIVSCFVIGALLCTLTSCGDSGSVAAKDALTVAAADVLQDSEAGIQDIRKTSIEENTREIVKASIKSTEDSSSYIPPETAVVWIASASVKSSAAVPETEAVSAQPVQTSEQSEAGLQETEQARFTAGQVQETEPGSQEVVPTIAPELENKVITTVDTYQNIRKEPSEDSEIVGRLYEGSAGDVLEESNGWTRISSGDVEGWVHNEYVVSGEEAQNFAEESLKKIATVTEEGVRVRAGASVDSTWIGVVNADETYQIVPEEGEQPSEEAAAEEAEEFSEAAQSDETVPAENVQEETQSVETQSGLENLTGQETASEEDTETQPEQPAAPLEWVKIIYEDGEEGYVCADYVTTSFALSEAKSMEQIEAEEEAKAQAEREAKAAEAKKASAGSSASEAAQSDSGWTSLGEFKITAYCGGACCNGKWAGTTASGASPAEGRTIAVAPWIIPYGTQVRIEGLDGIYVAEDTGGFANSNPYQIDLFVSEHSHAGSWGVRYRQVWVKR